VEFVIINRHAGNLKYEIRFGNIVYVVQKKAQVKNDHNRAV